MEIWAVVGHANTHKTSTIRALTGVSRLRRNWNVRYDAHGTVETFVHPAGLQESNVSPQDFIRMVNEAGVRYVIVALRYELAGEHPDAAGYLAAFQEAGWHIAGHAVLGHGNPLPGFVGGISIPDAANTPSNEIAAQLRQVWGVR